MKKLSLASFLLILCISFLEAQNKDRYWIMGRTSNTSNTTNISFDFYPSNLALYDLGGPPPTMDPGPIEIGNQNGFEGWGVVTVPQTGELLFYTDGEDVFDSNHQDITPIGGLGASASSSQAVAITVKPICPFDQYYIFSNPTGIGPSGTFTGPVTYRTYSVDDGFSAIAALPGPDGAAAVGEGMLMIPSKTDPFTSWLVVRLLVPTVNGSEYVVYRIDQSGIAQQGTFNFGPPITDNRSPIMNMTYIDDGSVDQVIVGFSVAGSPNRVFTNQFNTSNGTFESVANELISFNQGILYDLEFSPGGNFLYFATYFPSVLYQIPIDGGPSRALRDFGNLRAGGLKRGPDGFIYHIYDAGDFNTASTTRIGRIIQPELAFDGSNFDELYQADFNSAVSMVYNNVFAYNFPEFADVPSLSAELAITGDNSICENSELEIATSINILGQAIESYEWMLDGVDIATTTDPVLNVNQPGLYQVRVNVEGGCSIPSNQLVVEAATNLPQIDALFSSATTCGENNGVIIVEASGGEAPLSYFVNGIPSTTANAFENLQPGSYSIEVQDQKGCTIRESVEIPSSDPLPAIESIDIQQPDCLGNNGSISIQTNSEGRNLEFALEETNYQASNQFAELVAGTYTIFIRDDNNCQTSRTVDLIQNENGPQITELISQASSCLEMDGSISISAIASNGGLSYSLDGVKFVSESTFSGLEAGNYLVSVRDDLGCISNAEAIVNQETALPIIESIQLEGPACSKADGLIRVQALTENSPLSYSIDGVNFQGLNEFKNLLPGTYTLRLQDDIGCNIDSTFILQEKECPVYLPNAFSPNGDGVNDRFQVYSNGDPSVMILSYDVYDRWGGHIYTASNFRLNEMDQFWDGTNQGEKLGIGAYVYVIEITYGDEAITILSGNIQLVR